MNLQHLFYFFQVRGNMRSNKGTISSLPISILSINTNFESDEKIEKLPIGPTSERPGPTLPSVVATEVKLVIKSKLSKLIKRSDVRNIARYETI